MAKTYIMGLGLHDSRTLLGVPRIIHTGRVNGYARCMGGELKAANNPQEARNIMSTKVGSCVGPKTYTVLRKDGKSRTVTRKRKHA